MEYNIHQVSTYTVAWRLAGSNLLAGQCLTIYLSGEFFSHLAKNYAALLFANTTFHRHHLSCIYLSAAPYQLINESADVDDRKAGHNVLADHHTVDKALGCMAEVGAHEAPRGAEGPALG